MAEPYLKAPGNLHSSTLFDCDSGSTRLARARGLRWGIICGCPATFCTVSVRTLGLLPPWMFNPLRETVTHPAVTSTLAPRR